MKALTVVGARPQFIKAAVVSRAIRNHNQKAGRQLFQEIIAHTGQHFDANMSDIFFEEMDVPRPKINLGINQAGHGAMTGRMLEALERVMLDEAPDAVLVYGDTNSTLAGALAAVKLQIPVAHVEAGLRSFNRRMPEEINRVLTDHAADILFAPTETAVRNLKREGILDDKIHLVGDVMYDAVLYYRKKAKPSETTKHVIDLLGDGYYLTTVHRAENTDDPARIHEIWAGLCLAAEERPVVFPVHPRTQKLLRHLPNNDRIYLLDPVGYFDMLCLLENCKAVLTDSGGLQKEAYFFGKPCVTLREETEWVELVEIGVNILAGASSIRIADALARCESIKMRGQKLCGEEDAGEKIVRILEKELT